MLKENPFPPSSLQAAKYKQEPREMREAREDQRQVAALSARPFAPVLSAHPGGVNSDTRGHLVVIVQSLSCVRLFVTPRTAAHLASMSFTVSRSLLKFSPLSLWCHPTISPSVIPFSSYFQSFLASGFFPVSQFFASGGQSIGVSASASVLPMNIQDWFTLGLSGLISLQSKRLSRVFSNTTVQKHQFFGAQLSLWSNSHIHTWLQEKP